MPPSTARFISAALLSLAGAAYGDDASSPPSPSEPAADAGFATADAGTASGGDAGAGLPTEAPVPTSSAAELEAWLATGAYKRWACEAVPHAARPGSAHVRNRICTNAALTGDRGTGERPVGAAAVKELYDASGRLDGYAVAVKEEAGTGGRGFYWYERSGTSVFADGRGVGLCAQCHAGAPRDHVFTSSLTLGPVVRRAVGPSGLGARLEFTEVKP